MKVNIGEVPAFKDVKADKPQALKVLEEASEVVEAVKTYEAVRASGLRIEAAGRVAEECADVIQATANLLAALDVDDLTEDLLDCRDRNEARGRRYE